MTFLRDLPPGWLAAALTVGAVGLTWWWRTRRRHGPHRHRDTGWSAAGRDAALGAAPDPGSAPVGDQRALLAAANAVRDALDRQTREMGELRAFWSRRVGDLEQKVEALTGAAPPATANTSDRREDADRGGSRGADDGVTYDARQYGAEGLGRDTGTGHAWSPGPQDQPVEIRDGVLVASRSLPPAGYVSTAGSDEAQVFLNADVPLTEFSLPKWATFFDLQGVRPYAAYRTARPAMVRWNVETGRGELIRKGVAEPL